MLENKLEEIKKAGYYAVQVFYGEDIGYDDLDVPQNERKLHIVAVPVGYLGGVKVLWKGNLSILKDFSPKSKPIKIDNPPKTEQYEDNGFYCWGIDRSVDKYLKRFDN